MYKSPWTATVLSRLPAILQAGGAPSIEALIEKQSHGFIKVPGSLLSAPDGEKIDWILTDAKAPLIGSIANRVIAGLQGQHLIPDAPDPPPAEPVETKVTDQSPLTFRVLRYYGVSSFRQLRTDNDWPRPGMSDDDKANYLISTDAKLASSMPKAAPVANQEHIAGLAGAVAKVMKAGLSATQVPDDLHATVAHAAADQIGPRPQ